MAVYIIGAVIAYLVGSINTAFIVATLKKKNLRSGGSGNLGASNTAILLGFKWGLFVGIVDILKGFVLVIISKYVLSDYAYLPYIVTSAVIIGHIFPFYLKFKGGKGFASLVGCIFGFDWRVGLVAAVLIIAITVISDYIVLATLTTIILYPITVGIMTLIALVWQQKISTIPLLAIGFIIGLISTQTPYFIFLKLLIRCEQSA